MKSKGNNPYLYTVYFRASSECNKIIKEYCDSLNLSKTELLNEMIIFFQENNSKKQSLISE